jgi:hypothetical protein
LLIRSLPSFLFNERGAFSTRCLEKVQLIIVQMAQSVLMYSQAFHLIPGIVSINLPLLVSPDLTEEGHTKLRPEIEKW